MMSRFFGLEIENPTTPVVKVLLAAAVNIVLIFIHFWILDSSKALKMLGIVYGVSLLLSIGSYMYREHLKAVEIVMSALLLVSLFTVMFVYNSWWAPMEVMSCFAVWISIASFWIDFGQEPEGINK